MKKTAWLSLLVLIACFAIKTSGQSSRQKPFTLRPPLDIPMRLTGTFGELRHNHFHSGIDISTGGAEGKSIYAAEDGYLYRVKISPWGFGKALYLQHDNGLITVYAHLKDFASPFDSLVRAIQKREEQYEIDYYAPAGAYPVIKGEVIARSGNTGSSGAPHLHFEVRKGEELAMNPLRYGFEVPDQIPPFVRELYVYQLDSAANVLEKISVPLRGRNGRYSSRRDTVEVHAGWVALGIESYDRLNGMPNKNGIYRIDQQVDERMLFNFAMDSFYFEERRYINAHMDYRQYVEKRQKTHNCFVQPGNKLSIYKHFQEQEVPGVFKLLKGQSKACRVKVLDFSGNETIIELYVKASGQALSKRECLRPMPTEEPNFFYDEGFSVAIPPNSLYQEECWAYQREKQLGAYSDHFSILNSFIACHRPYYLSIEARELPDSLHDKALIVLKDHRSRMIAQPTYYELGRFKCRPDEFGTFYLTLDTIAPSLQRLSHTNKRKGQRIYYRVSDNLSGIRSFTATLDGEWVILEYEPKKNLLFYEIEDDITAGEHIFVIRVEDWKNNTISDQVKLNITP